MIQNKKLIYFFLITIIMSFSVKQSNKELPIIYPSAQDVYSHCPPFTILSDNDFTTPPYINSPYNIIGSGTIDDPFMIQGIEIYNFINGGLVINNINDVYVSIRNCSFHNGDTAISLNNCHNINITNCSFTSLSLISIELKGSISGVTALNISVSNCSFNNINTGISLKNGCQNISITYNSFNTIQMAVYNGFLDNDVFIGNNSFLTVQNGISMEEGINTEISNNTFIGTSGTSILNNYSLGNTLIQQNWFDGGYPIGNGICIQISNSNPSAKTSFSNNTLFNYFTQIAFINDKMGSVFKDNFFCNCSGIEMTTDTVSNPTFYNNTFIIYSTNQQPNSNFAIHWDYNGYGNFWSNYHENYPNASQNTYYWATSYALNKGADHYPLITSRYNCPLYLSIPTNITITGTSSTWNTNWTINGLQYYDIPQTRKYTLSFNGTLTTGYWNNGSTVSVNSLIYGLGNYTFVFEANNGYGGLIRNIFTVTYFILPVVTTTTSTTVTTITTTTNHTTTNTNTTIVDNTSFRSILTWVAIGGAGIILMILLLASGKHVKDSRSNMGKSPNERPMVESADKFHRILRKKNKPKEAILQKEQKNSTPKQEVDLGDIKNKMKALAKKSRKGDE